MMYVSEKYLHYFDNLSHVDLHFKFVQIMIWTFHLGQPNPTELCRHKCRNWFSGGTSHFAVLWPQARKNPRQMRRYQSWMWSESDITQTLHWSHWCTPHSCVYINACQTAYTLYVSRFVSLNTKSAKWVTWKLRLEVKYSSELSTASWNREQICNKLDWSRAHLTYFLNSILCTLTIYDIIPYKL